LFPAQKLTTSQRREAILHLARHELRYLFIGLLILFIFTTLFFEYIVNTEKDEIVTTFYSNAAIDISSGVAFLASLIVARTTGERNDKSFTYLAIGLGCWFCAELIYTTYQIFCRISTPYPTIADIIWIAGYFFLGAYFYKTIKFWHETKRVKFYSIVIASFIIAVLVGNYIYSILLGSEDESQAAQECLGPLQQVATSSIIFDVLYYLGNGAILIPALVTVSNIRVKDPFFLHRILISTGVIISFLFGDILFIYYGDFIWYDDVFYNTGYICFALALIWYYKISQLLNKNINDCIQQSDKIVKNVQNLIDTDNDETNKTKEPEGVFENIYDPNKADDYLKRLLIEAKDEIRLLLSTIGIGYIIKKTEVYSLLLEKAKETTTRIRILLPYGGADELLLSKLSEDSKQMIKVQYIRNLYKPNQLVLLVDNKYVLNITLLGSDSKEVIKNAIYSSKESVVLCYTNMIEYQSLISEI
jgi:hypothetical protein